MRDIIDGFMYSRSGRFIGPKNKNFPGFREMFYGLSNIPRFCGQGEHAGRWNVLKHSVCVAMLMAKRDGVGFFAGIFHDFPEMFIGDIPTPFKHPAVRSFEKKCQAELLQRLSASWEGFDSGAHFDRNYKHEDRIMLDVEARLSLKCDFDAYHEAFAYSPMSDLEKSQAEELFRAVREISNEDLIEVVSRTLESSMVGRGQNSGQATQAIKSLGRFIYLGD